MNYILETFTLNHQKINLALPKNFNFAEKYSIYLVFDGQEILTTPENNILIKNSTNKIFIGLNNKNSAVRFNNLATYENQIVKQLMTKYFPDLNKNKNNYLGKEGQATINFINDNLLPWLTKEKHITISDLNLLGCSMGAYFSLQMLYLSKLTFKKVYLFSPSIWFNQQILADLKTQTLNNNNNLIINLWVGEKEPKLFEKTILTNYVEDAQKLVAILTKKEKIKINFFTDKNGAHGFKWWINFLNQNQELY